MASIYQTIEDAISNAITILNKEFFSTPIKAAKVYNVVIYMIQQKLQKIGS